MSDISSSSSTTPPQRSPRVRRCRKTTSRTKKGSGSNGQAKRFSSCGVVRMASLRIPKPSLSSPEDLEVDSILQSSSSSDDNGNISSSISSDDEEDADNHYKLKSIRNINTTYAKEKVTSNFHSESTTANNMQDGLTFDKSMQSSQTSPDGTPSNQSTQVVIEKESNNPQNVLTENERKTLEPTSESSRSSSTITKISNLERLIRTHPLWFQPDMNRDDITQLLQGKEDGVRFTSLFQSNHRYLSISVHHISVSHK